MARNRMRLLLSHCVVAAAGICIGFLYQGYSGQRSSSTDIEMSSASVTAADKAQPTITSVSSDHKANQKLSVDKTIEKPPGSALADNMPIGTPVVVSENSSTSLGFLANTYIEMLETEEFESVVSMFSAWFVNSDNPGPEIIDFLLSENKADEKEVLEYLVASGTAMGTHDGLAVSIIKQLANADESNYAEWENIVPLIAVNSKAARTELLNILPNVADEKIVAASLIAIRPDVLPPAERAQVLSDLAIYAENSSEEIKSAAVVSLGQWSAHNYTHIVEDMLSNGSMKEKRAALFTAAGGQMWSDQIQYQTLTTLNDESLPVDLRMSAFDVLSQQILDEQSYADYYRFYEQYILSHKKP